MEFIADWETWLLDEFRWLHAHPELANEEFQTTNRLRENLTRLGITVLDVPLSTGLAARIGTGAPPHIALRADIDALPVAEQTQLPYRSVYTDKMHACGHDFHTTAVLGAIYLLKAQEKNLRGTVTVIFQPAEENAEGAKKILAAGALDAATAIWGLHSSPLLDVGTVGISAGAVTASVDRFGITFQGKSSHVAHPEKGTDPIIMAAQFITAVHSVRGQNVDPANANLIGVTHVKSGNTWNVMPATAWLEGTVRSFSPADREKIKARIYELAAGIAAAYGGQADVEWIVGPPPTANDEELAQIARQIASTENLRVIPAPTSLIGEDFACYQEKMRGMFVIVGTGKSAALHNPHFCVAPGAIIPTVKYLHKLCLTTLQ